MKINKIEKVFGKKLVFNYQPWVFETRIEATLDEGDDVGGYSKKLFEKCKELTDQDVKATEQEIREGNKFIGNGDKK